MKYRRALEQCPGQTLFFSFLSPSPFCSMIMRLEPSVGCISNETRGRGRINKRRSFRRERLSLGGILQRCFDECSFFSSKIFWSVATQAPRITFIYFVIKVIKVVYLHLFSSLLNSNSHFHPYDILLALLHIYIYIYVASHIYLY